MNIDDRIKELYDDRVKHKSIIVGLIIVIILFIAIGTIYIFSKRGQYNELTNLNTALNDTLHKTTNNVGNLENKILVLTTASKKDFIKLQTKDKEVQHLQQEVKYYKSHLIDGSSVTTITTTTSADTTIPTIVYLDDFVETDCDTIYPTYYITIDQFDDWITGDVTMDKDSTKLNLNIIDSLTLMLGVESKGFLKGKQPIAIATYKNPYTNVNGLRSYQIEIPKKHTMRNIGVGAIIGTLLTILITK